MVWFTSLVGRREKRRIAKLDRLMIWRFEAAPKTLRALHRELETPEWLILIPRALSGADLDEVIQSRDKSGQTFRYETADGDIVYIGTTQVDRLSQRLPPLTARRR